MMTVVICRRILKCYPLLMACIGLAGCLQTITPAYAVETGIRGTALWGPVRPGPSKLEEVDEAPLRASFAIYSAAHKIKKFESDCGGRFQVSLPPGDYTIVPDKSTPIPSPESQKTRVTVPEDGFTDIIIRLDTGMK